MAELRRALLEWKVLFFRDQAISCGEQRAFAARWGRWSSTLSLSTRSRARPTWMSLPLAKDAQTGGVENLWHNDVTWHEFPSFASVLRAVEIPPVGGDTLWADMAAAYDLLPDDIKARIDPLMAERDISLMSGQGVLRPKFMLVQHPVVRVISETGRRVLFVNMAFTQRIVGLPEAESNALLAMLYRHVQRPELQVRLRWQPNTVASHLHRGRASGRHYRAEDCVTAMALGVTPRAAQGLAHSHRPQPLN